MKYTTKSIIFIITQLLMLSISSINGQSADCKAALAPWFDYNSEIGITITIVDNAGGVRYAVGSSLEYMNTQLRATNSYPALDSTREVCANGKVQPFDAHQPNPLFFDATGLVFNDDATVSMSIAGEGGYHLNLTLCSGNIFSGVSNNKLFTYYFSKTISPNLGANCGTTTTTTTSTPTPSTTSSSTGGSGVGVAISTVVTNSWNDGVNQYTQYSTTLTNTAANIISSLVIQSSNLQLRDSTSIWNMVPANGGGYSLPSYVTSLGAGSTHSFGFIAVGSTAPTFTVKSIIRN